MRNEPARAFRAAILEAIGFAPEHVEPGKLHRFSTRDRGQDDAGWCRLFDDLRAGVYGCHRRGITATWCAACDPQSRDKRIAITRELRAAQAEREARQRDQWAMNAERNARLWAACVPIERGDPIARYLAARGLGELWPLPPCLRTHPALAYWHDGRMIGEFATMVTPLVGPDGALRALHRTYTSKGAKADVPSQKKLTGTSGPLAGACIPLFAPARGAIGIAEGIETALAAHLASGVPMVAAYSASSLAGWQWPVSVRRIVIFADADDAGRQAADLLHERARASGIRCDALFPTREGADWADVWAERPATITNEEAAT